MCARVRGHVRGRHVRDVRVLRGHVRGRHVRVRGHVRGVVSGVAPDEEVRLKT